LKLKSIRFSFSMEVFRARFSSWNQQKLCLVNGRFHLGGICRAVMCRISRLVQCCSFRFLSRDQCFKFSLSSSVVNSTMIGSKTLVQNTSTSPQLIIVEGNIGVGKSTLACHLARQLNYRVFLEPTTKNPYLAKFYRDPKKYALKLQLWIFNQRFRTYIDATKHILQTGQ